MYRLQLILKNISIRKKYTIYIFLIISLYAMLLSGSISIVSSLSEGVKQTSKKLGAGAMIVSESNETVYEDVILSGNATQSYISRDICNILTENNIPYTYQIYLKSLQAGCCSIPIQIIGYDPDTDFIVTPWIKSYTDNLKGVVLGHSAGYEGDEITLFGTSYPILARLDETGSGLDRSVYIPMEMIPDMWQDSIEKGAKYTYTDVSEIVSAILLKDEDIEKAQTVLKDEKVTFILPGKMVSDMENSLYGMKSLIMTFLIIFGVMVGISLGAMTSLSLDGRRKEFSILRLTGISMKNISYNLLIENFIVSIFSSLLGSISGLYIISTFSDGLAKSFNIPYVKDISLTTGIYSTFIPTIIYMLITALFILFLKNKNFLEENQSLL